MRDGEPDLPVQALPPPAVTHPSKVLSFLLVPQLQTYTMGTAQENHHHALTRGTGSQNCPLTLLLSIRQRADCLLLQPAVLLIIPCGATTHSMTTWRLAILSTLYLAALHPGVWKVP